VATGQDPAIAELIERFDVSRETLARLDAYVELLKRWQSVKNLVAPATLPDIWRRHVLDSAQVIDLVGAAKTIADLGSGAGFPGMVLAIMLSGRGQTVRVHLVESNGRKASFLREAGRETGAPVEVHAGRIESFVADAAGRIDVVTARALAPMAELLVLSEQLLKSGARGLFIKGQDVEQELTDASKSWRINADLIRSITDPSSRIVRVTRADRVGAPGQQRIGP
jgi:16S rRNA (guanine527-N7)-methyltransferase